jgi:hypothetical protein
MIAADQEMIDGNHRRSTGVLAKKPICTLPIE